MNYTRLNLKNGDKLTEEHLKHIEDAIIELNGESSYDTYEVVWTEGGLDVNSGSANKTENRRRTNDYIPISYQYINLSATQNYHVLFYDASYSYIQTEQASSFISSISLDVSSIMPEGAAFYKILSRTGDVSQDAAWTFSTLPITGSTNEIIVDCNGNGDYTTIEDALANANDSATNHVIIRVRPGIYYPAPKTTNSVPYKETNRNLSIIGDNRNKVILRGECGYYYYQIKVDYAPLRLNGNIRIENLTIESNSSMYTQIATENGWDLESPHCRAYCIHVDGNRSVGDEILIKNCRLVNDHFTTIGFGLRQDSTLRIENCELITTTTDDTLSGFSNYGTLYGHLSAGEQATGQRLEVLYNRIINKGYDTAINLMDGSEQTEGCEASYLLIGNVCSTTNKNNAFKVANNRNFWAKDSMCFGNNIESMNAEA